MPVIDGKVHRSRFTSLKLRELSSVDNPAQPGARMAIMKRADPVDNAETVAEVAKYVCENDGAHSFSEVLAENKFNQDVWPCVDALSQSIRSIVGDASLTGGDREAQISASVEDFLSAVRDISPEVSKQLEPLLVKKREAPMPKTVEELQSDVTKLEGQVADLTSKLDAAEKAKTDAMNAKEEADENCKTAKAALAAATDDVVKVSGKEIKKSEVGEANFTTLKAVAEERDTATLEKRAGAEFGHVVGTEAEKAQVLRLVANRPEDDPVRKSLEAILTSCEKMTAAGFSSYGGVGGDAPTNKAAVVTFDQKVNEIASRDNIAKSAAMSKARAEYPDEFAAAYPDSVDHNDALAN